MSVDYFADAIVHIKNSDFVAKKHCDIKPTSKLLEKVLKIMADEKYIAGYNIKSREGKEYFYIELNGNIGGCKAIKPRFAVNNVNFDKFEKRYLPAKGVGILLVSTSEGVMTHIEAKKKNIGGRLLVYVY
jgi:small subunit ribosomal protein S8